MQDGFLNKWHADIPVGGEVLTVVGVCLVQLDHAGKIRRNEASRQHRHRPEGRQSTNRSPCAPGLFRTEGCVCRLSPGDRS